MVFPRNHEEVSVFMENSNSFLWWIHARRFLASDDPLERSNQEAESSPQLWVINTRTEVVADVYWFCRLNWVWVSA